MILKNHLKNTDKKNDIIRFALQVKFCLVKATMRIFMLI